MLVLIALKALYNLTLSTVRLALIDLVSLD
jgi:hypothetical protein